MKLTPDLRRVKEDGTYPIIFRVSCNGQSRSVPTGFSCKENEWSNRNSNLKETHPAFTVIAPRLIELKVCYLQKTIDFEKTNRGLINVQKLKAYLICEKTAPQNVYEFWQAEIALLNKAGRNGGAQVYKEALVAIGKIKNLNISFEEIDYNFLKEIEAEFLGRGVKINTLGIHFRELRAIFNKAIKAKIVSREYYPFCDYRIKKEKTRPRTINMEELQAYFKLSLDKKSYLYDSWLMGKLMFMLIGINFKDMILLKEKSIKENRICYNRAKTKTLYSIRLLPAAQEIINHFNGRDTNTLLGVLNLNQLENKGRFTLIIRQKNKVFNDHLKKIGNMIGCKEKLTGYVFRYTHANIAKQLGYSRDLIAEALGHQYGNKITGIYLEDFDLVHVDEMNLKIYEAIMGR